MLGDLNTEHRWGVVLAGGDGIRMRPLVRLISGDDRPKQFCALLGRRSLLDETKRRIKRSISPRRTLFALLKSHEPFYGKELQGVPPSRLVVQPLNRGTLSAVLYALSRLKGLDRDAVVAFFPSDHHYSNEDNFAAGIDLAFNAAENNANSVVLLGAPATYAATDYGWIQVEPARSTSSYRGLLRARRFWEKPSLEVAEDLLDRGCVWNTFVMIGRARAFVNVIRSAAPDFYEAFRSIWGESQPEVEEPIVSKIYQGLAVADLSREVLSKTPESLGVFCLGDVGWSDLGDPRRALEVLQRSSTEADDTMTALWRSETMHVASNVTPERQRSKSVGDCAL
jgi:mannose-1-phosphate guanylyltransferase